MDELIGVVVMVLYLVAAGVAGKNKKQKKAKQRAARRQTATQFDQAFSGEGKRPPARSAPQTASLRRESVSEGVDPCHDSMLRHERPAMRVQGVNQAQMRAAGEGEDPCHIAAASDMPMAERQITVDRSPIFNTEDSEAFASDVLRGVIMSEVLKRPCQRRAGGYTKRGA